MKQLVSGRGRGNRPIVLDDPAGTIFTGADDPVPTATRRVGGKTYFLGAWRSETKGQNYERWKRAGEVADEIVELRTNLKASGLFRDEGVNAEMFGGAGMVIREKTRLFRDLDKSIADVTANGQALYDLDDWDINSPYHDRLLRRWNSLPEGEQKLMLRQGLDPDLTRALICEPEFTSGIDDETRITLRESLLTDDEKDLNAQYNAELAQMQAVAKAWDAATELVLEQAQTTEPDLIQFLVIDDDDEPEPPEEGIDSLATGGVFKIDLTGDDNAQANTD